MFALSASDKGTSAGEIACNIQRWYSSYFGSTTGGSSIVGSTIFPTTPMRVWRYSATSFELISCSRESPEIPDRSTSICTSAGLEANVAPKSVTIRRRVPSEGNWFAAQSVLAASERSKLVVKSARDSRENETLLLRTASANPTAANTGIATKRRNIHARNPILGAILAPRPIGLAEWSTAVA
jgi:hypothetical protein